MTQKIQKPPLSKAELALFRKLSPQVDATAVPVVEAYCRAWGEFRAASEIIDKEGRVLTGNNGYLQPHPATALQKSAMSLINALAKTLALKVVQAKPEQVIADKWKPFAQYFQ